MPDSMVKIYTKPAHGERWMTQVAGRCPLFCLTLGFTETGLIPNISAAGATPELRRYTAIADAEFIVNGPTANPQFSLPPLQAGASPALITRAAIADQQIPVQVFNAGLPQPPAVPSVDLGGRPARCLTTGQALDRETVQRLWRAGLTWGERLATSPWGYLILGECVVGGTTTALALLKGLGVEADGLVNSSHPTCNHQQKHQIVQLGLSQLHQSQSLKQDALAIVAAVGDPMQPFVAGLAMAASRHKPVMLAGGTQMLAVYALMAAMGASLTYDWNAMQVVVGTTRWVVEDPTGNTLGLAKLTATCIMATQLSFRASCYPALRSYEAGFVKEGVGAGGCAIATYLYQDWSQPTLLASIEALFNSHQSLAQASTTLDQINPN
jgi:uncharacterized protein (TIGR00303 family)